MARVIHPRLIPHLEEIISLAPRRNHSHELYVHPSPRQLRQKSGIRLVEGAMVEKVILPQWTGILVTVLRLAHSGMKSGCLGSSVPSVLRPAAPRKYRSLGKLYLLGHAGKLNPRRSSTFLAACMCTVEYKACWFFQNDVFRPTDSASLNTPPKIRGCE